MKSVNILMLGGAKRVSLARHIKEAARQLGYGVSLYSYELSRNVAISIEGEVIVGKKWGDPDLQADLERVVREYAIDIIVPFVDGAIEPIALFAQRHPEVFVPVSSPELCAAMFDKAKAYEYFSRLDVPQPPLASPAGPYPVIAKPRCGSASKGIEVLRSEADISRLTQPNEQYIFQKYICPRREYTVDCYVHTDGTALAVVPRERLETAGGEVVRSITVDDADLLALAYRVLEKSPFRGFVTLQFLRDMSVEAQAIGCREDCSDNQADSRESLMLMEVNPRPGGGIVCSICAGANFAALLLQAYLTRQSDTPTLHPLTYEPQTETARYLSEAVLSH